ncbi:hypothetical protein KOM00_12715 [Geomonas sp. Red69]|uniref:Uncharacterized protein n=1 Tax=Geomonas diazotrophica TaxID=2843197 RepID=A0ABX8JLN4_9BACT|nr:MULTISPECIES: hypothetical protein [Geomonas]MBU5637591.1 hypothetical protein [Geomonas diazotrophica]QWV99289.1 hypothetical protein KP005_08450 [Geomonas nitrogeniifigens]QXE88456.1 hypothetical protein KP003_08700 [Geomonas nitrogeniifigens]
MQKLIREIPLSNGLTVRFFDATRRYFGDYHQVRIHICCEVPLSPDLFPDEESHQAAMKLLGASVSFKKDIEHQGVPSLSVDQTVERVIADFAAHSLGYFNSPGFPMKLVQAELTRARGRRTGFVPRGVHG